MRRCLVMGCRGGVVTADADTLAAAAVLATLPSEVYLSVAPAGPEQAEGAEPAIAFLEPPGGAPGSTETAFWFAPIALQGGEEPEERVGFFVLLSFCAAARSAFFG